MISKQTVSMLVGACLTTLGLCAPLGAENASDVVATWKGGSLERADYQDWRVFHQLDDTPEAVRERVYVESMAAASRARHVDGELRIQLELEAIRQQVLTNALQEHVRKETTVSDEEIEQQRLAQPDAFQRPRKLELSSIYKRLGDDDAAVRAQMQEIHAKLLAGADFEQLARTESESQARFRDGKLGFVDPTQLPPAVAAAVRDLEPGQISEVVEGGGGLSIFRCEEIRPAVIPTVDEVRSKLRQSLHREKRNKWWNRLEISVFDKAAPRIDPDSSTTVLTFDGYQLSAAGLAELVALRFPDKTVADFTTEQRERLLHNWALGELMARHAVELGLDKQPEVAAALRWKPLDILAQAELVRRIDARQEAPTEETLRKQYEAHPKRYVELPSFRVAVIHFAPGDEDSQRDRVQEAIEVAGKVQAGELSFEDAARRYSVHPSAADGGVLGWRSQPQLAALGPVVGKALRQLQPGESSGLLRLQSGLWMLKMLEKRPARRRTFEEAREVLLEDVRKQQIEALQRTVREEQLASLDLKILTGPAASRSTEGNP